MLRAFACSALAAGAVLIAGCGGDAEPDAVYRFRLDAAPVTLAAADTCAPLDSLVAKPIDQQYEDVAGHQKRWDQSRQAVEALLRQGLERLEAPNRSDVCAHEAGRTEYAALADATARLARSLGKSRDRWIEFASGMEPEEILKSGLGKPRSKLEVERDKRIEELIAKVDGMLTRAARARVEQARLFLAAGDSATGFEAAADVRALITEFELQGEEIEAISAAAAKLATAPSSDGDSGSGDGDSSSGG